MTTITTTITIRNRLSNLSIHYTADNFNKFDVRCVVDVGIYEIQVNYRDRTYFLAQRESLQQNGTIIVKGTETTPVFEIINDNRKPCINWDHVHPDYGEICTNFNGRTFLRPYNSYINNDCKFWCNLSTDGQTITPAETFSSFVPGSCDWKDSRVVRPIGDV